MLKILILGGASAIAQGTAKSFAQEGAELFLADLDLDKLSAIKDDLMVRGAKRVEILQMDASDFERHQKIVDTAIETLDGLDAALIAYGTLGDQAASQASVEVTLRELNLNFMSVVSFLTILANYFEKQKRGNIAVISSAAGDRGRPSNYVYGTAKGALTVFLQGLRARLAKSGVSVLTVKPGRVDSPMTADFKKNFLFANPDKVGADIHKSMKGGKDMVYVPRFWGPIMLIIRNIPEFIFKKLSM
jgi:short-subunit dehydrogenase